MMGWKVFTRKSRVLTANQEQVASRVIRYCQERQEAVALRLQVWMSWLPRWLQKMMLLIFCVAGTVFSEEVMRKAVTTPGKVEGKKATRIDSVLIKQR